MADKKIEDATRVSSVNGTEILPASVSSAAKSLTTAQVAAYVAQYIAGLADAASFGGVTDDRIIVRASSELKHISKDTLVDLVFNELTGKDAATTLTDNDVVIVKNGDAEKTTTLGAIKTYVSAAFSGNMDIHSLDAADAATGTDELAVYKAATDDEEAGNKKVTVDQIAEAVCGEISGNATTSSAALADTDSLLFCDASGNLKKVAKQDAGLDATGNVTGPSANTDAYVPQWNGTNTKTLKNGLQVVTSLPNEASDAQLPTAKAVKDAVDAVTTANNITMSGTATAGVIPVMTGSGKAADNATSKVTSIGLNPTDAQIPTAKAVEDYGNANYAKIPANITAHTLANYYDTTGQLGTGPSVVTSVSASSTDAQVPTAKAVQSALSSASGNAITAASIPAAGTIPYFATTGRAATTKTLATAIAATKAAGSNDKVLTEKAVTDVIYAEADGDTTKAFLRTTDDSASSSNKKVVVATDENGNCELCDIDDDSDEDSMATALYVRQKIGGAKGIVDKQDTFPGQGALGYKTGYMFLYDNGVTRRLYVNVGDTTSATWIKFTPDAS